MSSFRQENRYIIFVALTFGMYMKSLESFTSSKLVTGFFTVWTKLPMIVIPIYFAFDVRALIFDEMTVLESLGMARKVFVFCGFLMKNVLFYWNREKIERLMDLWDESFVEKFYTDRDLISRQRNHDKNKKIVAGYISLVVSAVFAYNLPSIWSKEKKLSHPSGIIYPRRSPEFEIVIAFNLLASLCAISAGTFDCLLAVLLSHVRYKLVFLREVLADIINEVVVDDEGRLYGRRTSRSDGPSGCLEGNFGGGNELYEEEEAGGEKFKRNMKKIDDKLRIWVLHHQQTIRFSEELIKVYSSMASLELGNNIIYTALTALNIVQIKLHHSILGILLVAACNLTSLFLWCKIAGDFTNVDPFGDGFGRAWFLLSKKMKTTFSFIIMRTKKPLALYGFSIYAINLATFFDIMKLTYQIFAFMMHVTSKTETAKE